MIRSSSFKNINHSKTLIRRDLSTFPESKDFFHCDHEIQGGEVPSTSNPLSTPPASVSSVAASPVASDKSVVLTSADSYTGVGSDIDLRTDGRNMKDHNEKNTKEKHGNKSTTTATTKKKKKKKKNKKNDT